MPTSAHITSLACTLGLVPLNAPALKIRSCVRNHALVTLIVLGDGGDARVLPLGKLAHKTQTVHVSSGTENAIRTYATLVEPQRRSVQVIGTMRYWQKSAARMFISRETCPGGQCWV